MADIVDQLKSARDYYSFARPNDTVFRDAIDEVTRLRAQNAELVAGLQAVKKWAVKAHAHWDADEDSKVGKILMALAGYLPSYSLDIAKAQAALAGAEAAAQLEKDLTT